MQNLSTSRVSYTIYIMWCSERHENCTYDKTTTTLKPVLSIQPAVDLKPLIPKTLTYTCMVTSGAFAWLDGSTLEPTFGTTARGAVRSAAPPPRFPGPRTGGGESEGDVVACKGPGMGVSTEPLDTPLECTEWPGVHDAVTSPRLSPARRFGVPTLSYVSVLGTWLLTQCEKEQHECLWVRDHFWC
jgi:hypothetical protein